MSDRGFREVAQLLRDGFAAQELAPGKMLPSEVGLAAKYGVSRTTLRRALRVLEEEGRVEVIPGRGRIVRALSDERAQTFASRVEFVAESLRDEYRRVGSDGGSLDSVPHLAERLAVSQATVRDALQVLSRDGLVTAIQGRGWHWKSDGAPESKTSAVTTRLREAITAGEWPEGFRLPGELSLAREYGVGRVTVRRALSQLAAEGLVVTKAGLGTVVRGGVPPEAGLTSDRVQK